jgi:hypothetical protein
VEGVLALRVGTLQIQQPAMTFNHGEAVEFARGRAIGHGAAMAPVDLALDAWGGCETDERALLGGSRTHVGEGLPHHGEATHEALLGQALTEHDGRDLGGDLSHGRDRVLEGRKLTGPGTPGPWWGGIVEICAGRVATATQGCGDLPYREALMRQAVDLKDGAWVNHGQLPESYG